MAEVKRSRHSAPYSESRDREVVAPVASGGLFIIFLRRLIGLAAVVVALLLAARFILAAIGANPGNTFVHHIYTITHAMAAPFYNIFQSNIYNGTNSSHVELYTILAIVVYLVAGWVLSSLFRFGRRY